VLRLFSRPSLLLSARPHNTDDQLANEVAQTYAILFNAYDGLPPHTGLLNALLRRRKWCTCAPCSAQRLTTHVLETLPLATSSPADPAMQHMMGKPAQDWDPQTFEYLWPVIVKMHQFQRDSRPWNFWVLLKDRRDTVKFWTFLFAAIVIPLTLLQLLVSVVQAVAGFLPDGRMKKGN
jgi:hypothetical protein